MLAPVVEPSPSGAALRRGPPEEAQEASYFAASARMVSFFAKRSSMRGRMEIVPVLFKAAKRPAADLDRAEPGTRPAR